MIHSVPSNMIMIKKSICNAISLVKQGCGNDNPISNQHARKDSQ